MLGLTFASLFPVSCLLLSVCRSMSYVFYFQDRIERMIVDGVVDTDDYYAGTFFPLYYNFHGAQKL